MRRRVVNRLALLSLLLLVAVCVLWVLSYSRPLGTYFPSEESRWGATLLRGSVFIWRQEAVQSPADFASFRMYYVTPHWSWGGFSYRSDQRSGVRWWDLYLPCWAIAAVLGVLPVSRLLLARRAAAKQRPNLCPACGYDVRATPGSCPECGWRSEQPDA